MAAERARLVKALVDEDLFDRQRRLPCPPSPPDRPGGQPRHRGLQRLPRRTRGVGPGLRRAGGPHPVQGRMRRRRWPPPSPPCSRHGCDVRRRRPGRRIQGRPGHLRHRAGGPGHRHLRHPGVDGDRPHRRPVGGRRGGQPGLHHPDRVRPGAGPAGHSILGDAVDAGAAWWPGWPAPGRPTPTRTCRGPAAQLATGARMQLDRHGDGLATGSSAPPTAVPGASSTPTRRAWPAGPRRWPERPAGPLGAGGTPWSGAPPCSPPSRPGVSRPRSASSASGAGCWAPTTTSASWSAATRSPGVPTGPWSAVGRRPRRRGPRWPPGWPTARWLDRGHRDTAGTTRRTTDDDTRGTTA